MKTLLIEAPRPNSTFAKFKNQSILPNILLDIAGVLDTDFELINALKDRHFVLPEADRYIVNISECVEKTVEDKYLKDLLSQLRDAKSKGKEIYLTGWYSWVNKYKLDFTVLNHTFYEKILSSKDLKFPSEIQPRWDLVDISKLPDVAGRKRATLRTSRGCPRNCKMCPVKIVYGGKMYYFPLDWVKKQIHILYDMGFREINFIDDNFTSYPKRSKELLNYLISCKNTTLKGMKYLFQEGMEVNDAQDEELLFLLKEAGFHTIKLGVESFSNESLKFIDKPYQDKELAINAIKNFNKIGIKPTVFILFGLPGETEETYRYLIDTMKTLKVKVRAQFLYDYDGSVFKSTVSMEKMKAFMDELVEVTGSGIWKRK